MSGDVVAHLASQRVDGALAAVHAIFRGTLLLLAVTAALIPLALAEPASEPMNSNIHFGYLPPRSLKYLPMVDRLKRFQLLEQLSQFLAPLRLPSELTIVTAECGEPNAWYQSWQRRIELCYEYVEAVERVAPKLGQPSEFSYEEVVIGRVVGTMLHELGHAVFNLLGVPVIGREEDAADQMATFIALQFNKDVARTMVRGQAYVFKVWHAYDGPIYYDNHGTGLQRYYNTLCLAYGADPALFGYLVERGELPHTRAAGCAQEYERVKRAFERTILPHIDLALMNRVQAGPWLRLSPQKAALLREQQQQQRQTFTLAVCNESIYRNVTIAFTVRLVEEPQKWQVLGWYSVPDNGCNLIGSFYGDAVYYYAEGEDNSRTIAWQAPRTDKRASRQCVDRIHRFRLDAGTRCKDDQEQVGFYREDLHPIAAGMTLHLGGGR